MSFFLHQELPNKSDSLERAVHAYKKSNYDTSVKQAVENLFEGSHSLSKNFEKNHHASEASLVKGVVQVALNNLLGMGFTIQSFSFANRSLKTLVKK